jgi:uncharacterized protein (UPF0332 family)/predicted nucleotidyltransferase
VTKTQAIHPAIAGSAVWQRATCEYVERLRDHYAERLVTVVLYGSRARGDADQESDVDLLVVLHGEFDHRAEQEIASDLRRDIEDKYCYPLLGPIIATENEYRHRMLPLFINVRREGVELWPIGDKRISDERTDYHESLSEDVQIVIAYAKEALADAEFGFKHIRYRWCANRAYYAVFHAATALLLSEGLAFSKHRGVIGAFDERGINGGKFPRFLGKRLREGFAARNIADYSYKEDISAELAEQLVRSAAAFVAEAERLLSRSSES